MFDRENLKGLPAADERRKTQILSLVLETSSGTGRQRQRPASLAVSVLIHALLFLVLYNVSSPVIPRKTSFSTTALYLPPAQEQPPAEPPPRRERLVQPPVSVVRTPPPIPAIEAPAPLAPAPPEIRPAPVKREAAAAPSAPTPPPTSAQQPVRTGVFGSAPVQPATPHEQPAAHTGVFGLPSATQAVKPNPTLALQVGSFEGAQARQTKAEASRAHVSTAGFGGARVETQAASGAVRAATFGDAASAPVGAAEPSRRTAARAGGFGSAAVSAVAVSEKAVSAAPEFGAVTAKPAAPLPKVTVIATGPETELEILHKPRPVYTEEARRLRIEGEVVLEALFTASGEVRVLRVVRGLGHGLDESATRAASAIRFRPAAQGGRPVDLVATVKIAFEVAF